MMATEAISENIVNPSTLPENELMTITENPSQSSNTAPGTLDQKDDSSKQDLALIHSKISSTAVSVNGASDSETSRVEASKSEGEEKTHLRTLSSTKKPASFKPVSVNKKFLAAKGTATATPSKLGDSGHSGSTVAQVVPLVGGSSARPRLVAKSGPGLQSAPRAATSSNGVRTAGAPDASAVWNKNRPAPPPEPKRFTDEELKQRYGIHLATRLQSDDVGKQANWADIDDDDEDWVPNTMEWADGTKVTLPKPDETPAPKPPTVPLEVAKLSKEKVTEPVKQKPPVPSQVSASPTVKAISFSGRGGLVLKGAAEKPTLVAKPPGPPTPVKSPWAPLPPVEKVAPTIIDVPPSQLSQPGPSSQKDSQGYQSFPSSLAKEIAADDFNRSWRDNPASSRELYNAQSGRYEPASDKRRGSIRGDTRANQPAVLQRPHQEGPAEPSPAFQTHRSGLQDNLTRRRNSSNVSGTSENIMKRMSRVDMPSHDTSATRKGSLAPLTDEIVTNNNPSSSAPNSYQRNLHSPAWQSRASPEISHSSPQVKNGPIAPVSLSSTKNLPQDSATPYQDPFEYQKKEMQMKREMAIARRREQIAQEEAERKERIRIKLESLGPSPEKKKKELAKTDPPKSEPSKSEPPKNEPLKSESLKDESQKHEPPKNELKTNEIQKNGPENIEASKIDPLKSEPNKNEAHKNEVLKTVSAYNEKPVPIENLICKATPSVSDQPAAMPPEPNLKPHSKSSDLKEDKPAVPIIAATVVDSPPVDKISHSEDRLNAKNNSRGPPSQKLPPDVRPSHSWQSNTTDNFKPWASAPPQQSSSRNVWGPPTNDRTLGNGTFNPELSRVLEISAHSSPIGPLNSNRSKAHGHEREYAIRPAPIGPPNRRRQGQGIPEDSAIRSVVTSSGWASLPKKIAEEDARRAQQQNIEMSRVRDLREKGLITEPTTRVVQDTWRQVTMKEDGSRSQIQANHTTFHHEPVQMWKGQEEPATTRGIFEAPDNSQRRHLNSINTQPQFNDAWRSNLEINVPPTRGSRFFPKNRDIRLEEQNLMFDRPESPSPPPPTQPGHPAYDGDVFHPHVSLPRPVPVVKLPPPKPIIPIAPIGPPKPISFAAIVATPAATPVATPVIPSNYRSTPRQSSRVLHCQDIRREDPVAGNWQDKINSLIGRKSSPLKSQTLAVNSSSKNALEVPRQRNSATVSLPSSTPGDLFVDSGSAESKPPAEECFEEQEMGSLPPVKMPTKPPPSAWNLAPSPKPLLKRYLVSQITSVEPITFTQQSQNNNLMVRIRVPGQIEAKMVSLYVTRQRSNPRRGGNRNNGSLRQHLLTNQRGRGRDNTSSFQSTGSNSTAINPKPSASGRGRARGYGNNWKRHTIASIET